MKRLAVSVVAVMFVAAPVLAQKPTPTKASMAAVTGPGVVNWGAPPPVLPAGAHVAVLSGDPNASGYYTLRLHMPNGYKIMPHFHPTDEQVTVLQGKFHVGMGDKFTTAGSSVFPAGGYVVAPANKHHYAWAEGDVIVQVAGMGPFKLTYVNPTDDPTAKKK